MLLLFFVQCLPRVSDVIPRLCNAFRGLVMSPRLCNVFRGLVMSSPACAMSSEGRLAPRCCAGHVTKLAVPFGPARQVTTACFYALGRHTHRRGVTTPFLLRKVYAQGGRRPFFCGRHMHRRGTTPFLLRKTHAQAGDNALSSAEGIRTGEGQRPFFCGRHMHRQEEDMHFLFGKTVDR